MSDAEQDESWLPVIGYEGLYEVSRHGQVRSVDRTVHYADGRTRRYPACPLRQAVGSNGYRKDRGGKCRYCRACLRETGRAGYWRKKGAAA